MFDPKIPELKPFDGQLLSMLARGYKAQRIADELHISQNYVYFLMRELRERFLVLSNPALVSRAIAEGMPAAHGNKGLGFHPIAAQHFFQRIRLAASFREDG